MDAFHYQYNVAFFNSFSSLHQSFPLINHRSHYHYLLATAWFIYANHSLLYLLTADSNSVCYINIRNFILSIPLHFKAHCQIIIPFSVTSIAGLMHIPKVVSTQCDWAEFSYVELPRDRVELSHHVTELSCQLASWVTTWPSWVANCQVELPRDRVELWIPESTF